MVHWTKPQAPGANPAENYERYLVPTLFHPPAVGLVDLAAPAPGERVLDVATGTGIVVRLAAERVGPGGRVTGLDVNPGMLAVARSVTPPEAPVDWREASADAMPLPDGGFDVVICQMGLQFFPDRPAALREMRRVLAPGGRLALSVLGPLQDTPVLLLLAELLGRHVGPQAAGFVRAVFGLDSTDELADLLVGADFREVAVRAAPKTLRVGTPDEFLRQYVTSTPLAGPVSQADDAAQAALRDEFVRGCQPYLEGDALTLSTVLHVATGRA